MGRLAMATPSNTISFPRGNVTNAAGSSVVRRLEDRGNGTFLLELAIPSSMTTDMARETVDAIVSASELIARKVFSKQDDSLRKLVELLVPDAAPTPAMLKEAVMQAHAKTEILQSGDWLTSSQLAEIAGLSKTNASTQPNKWKKDGVIFAIQKNGVDHFPMFGLDPNKGYRPLKAMSQVIACFGDKKSGWGLAYWFGSVNSFIGGKRPQDLIGLEPQRVIDAAKDELAEMMQG